MATIREHFESQLAEEMDIPTDTLRDWIRLGKDAAEMIDWFKTSEKVVIQDDALYDAVMADIVAAATQDLADYYGVTPEEIKQTLGSTFPTPANHERDTTND